MWKASRICVRKAPKFQSFVRELKNAKATNPCALGNLASKIKGPIAHKFQYYFKFRTIEQKSALARAPPLTPICKKGVRANALILFSLLFLNVFFEQTVS